MPKIWETVKRSLRRRFSLKRNNGRRNDIEQQNGMPELSHAPSVQEHQTSWSSEVSTITQSENNSHAHTPQLGGTSNGNAEAGNRPSPTSPDNPLMQEQRFIQQSMRGSPITEETMELLQENRETHHDDGYGSG